MRFRYTSEEALGRAEEHIPASVREPLASSAWKERLQGAQELRVWVSANAGTVDAELVARALAHKPGWRESNFQVLGEVFATWQEMARRVPSFDRAVVALTAQPLCEKLGDMKLKGPAGETLCVYAEHTSLGFVLHKALPHLSGIRAPKAAADAIVWVEQVLLAFGTAGVDVRGVVNYAVAGLSSANGGVRANSTKLVGTLARFVGTALGGMLPEVSAQLRANLDAEIERGAHEPPPAPTRGAGLSLIHI